MTPAYEPPLNDFHPILCRNVIIHFEREAQDALFAASTALAPGGILSLARSRAPGREARSRP
jgi:chemotaxis methyl-accepting protein methylase